MICNKNINNIVKRVKVTFLNIFLPTVLFNDFFGYLTYYIHLSKQRIIACDHICQGHTKQKKIQFLKYILLFHNFEEGVAMALKPFSN